ncbi:thioredoxin [candidate division WOR_3 bacterium SM23_60]|uniref:Thioredoxin n=1 Tax=candidate division WOR_3 bacterium SM23_60 TaxID=1703780 RepID=A0A0S8GH79_UNCW3|nr:MAG: thioredoxin [candidate division WOR_3 bacterium SM23_60]
MSNSCSAQDRRPAVSNRLIREKSPYLLQHAYNPVNWHPWGDDAFAQAREDDKPVFLSVGYSTCHWCHVMERESFEDTTVAKLLNDNFVSIKVDREERPDIDHVYMTVCQLMTGTGGWPLTIIMTPDKEPFFAATYIPKKDQRGRVGLLSLLPQISALWREKRSDLKNSAMHIVQVLKVTTRTAPKEKLNPTLLDRTFEELVNTFDPEHGGFGHAPKFPTPHTLSFLLRYWQRTGSDKALLMVEHTLEHMRFGGIFDHIGYGFHRYATDRQWLVPHFEKMLYDQALLTIAYTEAYQATRKKIFEKTTHEILEYVLREMASSNGGFYSAEDADSEGREGLFYVWTHEQIQEILGDQAPFFNAIFNIKREGNFHEEATRTRSAKNIIHLRSALPELAQTMHIAVSDLAERIENARARLYAARRERPHPHKDDKILTSWNGLMIAALAKAGSVFGRPQYIEAAAKAAAFVLTHVRTSDQRLLHRYRDRDAALQAHADDYAFFIWGLLELYEATFAIEHLETARALNEQFIAHYWDEQGGGFFFTAHDAEHILVRQKQVFDGALPSANSVALHNLVRLARMTSDPALEQKAEHLVHAFSSPVSAAGTAHTHFLNGVSWLHGPAYEIILVGDVTSRDTKRMLHTIRQAFIPHAVFVFKPTGKEADRLVSVVPYTESYVTREGRTTAYVCSNHVCKQPTTDPNEVLELLDVAEKSG